MSDPTCSTCNDQGFTMEGTLGGYYETPCPDCQPPTTGPEITDEDVELVRAHTAALKPTGEPEPEAIEDLAHSLWTYGALSFKDECEGGYGLADIPLEQQEAFRDLARNVLKDELGRKALRAAQLSPGEPTKEMVTKESLAKALWETRGHSSDQPEKFEDLDEQAKGWHYSDAQVVLDAALAVAQPDPEKNDATKDPHWPYTRSVDGDVHLRGCGGQVRYRVLNDDHDDREYRCDKCEKTWVQEGADS